MKENKKIPIPIDEDNPSIARVKERCIKCGRCSFICENVVGIKKTKKHVCINCGQCLLNCPTGAIVTKYKYKKVLDYIKDTEKCVVVQLAPAVRTSLGECFGKNPGENLEKKIVGALREIGFDYVFDTTFGADLTIMEEASEFVKRFKNQKNLPQFTSCCPSWVKYIEVFHPKLIDNLSTCKSPISMQNACIKNYFSEFEEIDKENIITVAITPCTAKKAEIKREEIEYGDYSLTTVELSLMIKELGIDFDKVKESEFDSIMKRGSSGGIIFGSSGGVMESTLRTAYFLLTHRRPTKKLLNLKEVRGYENIKEATIKMKDKKIRILVCHGIKNIENILNDIEKGIINYDFIEVMNCPGGCVGGGGQPLNQISSMQEVNKKRREGLYKESDEVKEKFCYANKNMAEIYLSYLKEPLSKKAKELLHTKYFDKSKILKED